MSRKGASVTWAEDLTASAQSQEPTVTKYKAKRYAVKFDPPCIFLEYEDTEAQRRVRAVKLNKVDPNVDIDRLTRKIIRSFPRKLDASTIKYGQIRKLVAKVVERVQQHHNALQASSLQSSGANSGSSTGRASPEVGTAAKARLLSHLGERGPSTSESLHSDDGDTYSTSAGSEDEDSHEDELDSALNELKNELGDLGTLRNPDFSVSAQPAGSRLKNVVRRDDGHDADVDNDRESDNLERLLAAPNIAPDTDLNKFSDIELKLAKLLMEKEFQKNQLKPGDEGFEYDKQVEFAPPTEDNDWDEDSSGEVSVREGTSRDVSMDWNDIASNVKVQPPLPASVANGKSKASAGDSIEWP